MEKVSINVNGQIQDAALPIFHVNNRAFRYGDGVFETMRFHNGSVLFADLHFNRLVAGMDMLRLDYDSRLTVEWMCEEVSKLSRSVRIFKSGRVRFSVYRAGAGLYTPETNRFAFVVELEKIEAENFVLNDKGYLADVFTGVILPRTALSRLKTTNALPYVLAAIFKKENGLDESFLLNDEGSLVEGTSTNIFLVKNNKVFTPGLMEGCTEGVMRQVVLELLAENGIQTTELSIPPPSLQDADEVFLTNAVQGIRWVGGYRQKRYYNQMAKKLTLLLNQRIELTEAE